jgi:hypothetical protein
MRKSVFVALLIAPMVICSEDIKEKRDEKNANLYAQYSALNNNASGILL